MASAGNAIDFANTKIAFQSLSTTELLKAKVLFETFGNELLVTAGPKLVKWALDMRLPVTPVIKYTVFNYFCGGVSIEDSMQRVHSLAKYGIRSILDYSVEGLGREDDFEDAFLELLKVTQHAAQHKEIPYIAFKVTGFAPFDLLEKISAKAPLSEAERKRSDELRRRIFEICATAAAGGVRVLIDAEESWIQAAIDALAETMMQEFNRGSPIVYNTLQLYRHDRLAYLKECHAKFKAKGLVPGFKLVRGAYMEKERERAKKHGLPDPIQPTREATDLDFNAALEYCVKNIESLGLFAGTHNEPSTKRLIELMADSGLEPGHSHVEFSQLLGMGDYLSFNLADAGYNVSKYVPYGPVKSVLPYLIRRAQENSSIKGQAGRELTLINSELKRRGNKSST